MLSRARRVVDASVVSPFDWEAVPGREEPGDVPLQRSEAPRHDQAELSETPDVRAQLAALERDGFARGYASGERAGTEAGAKRAEGMLRRIAQTVEELEQLKGSLARQTERQVVQLALALARRVVLRELTLDPDLVAAMAHVALARLGDGSPATIRLNPEDYAVIAAQRGEQWAGTSVSVLPDPALPRGGCLVESAFGVIDASVDAQLGELATALLDDAPDGGQGVVRAG
jgi:flagellar assembly protein FliH